MNDGSAISNGRASSVADAGPMLSRSMTARRVGSDRRGGDELFVGVGVAGESPAAVRGLCE